MNYAFNRDVTIKFKKGRMISDSSLIVLLRKLMLQGYADEVPDDVYASDKSEYYEKTHVNDVPLWRLSTIEEYQREFNKRHIRYNPLWRKPDYQAKAEQWAKMLIQREMRRRKGQYKKLMEEETNKHLLYDGEEY